MVKIHKKVMQADFAKSLKRLIIIAVCVMLLGGGTSAVVCAIDDTFCRACGKPIGAGRD